MINKLFLRVLPSQSNDQTMQLQAREIEYAELKANYEALKIEFAKVQVCVSLLITRPDLMTTMT